MSDRKMRVGFIGLGNQGGPIVRHLLAGGYPVKLWARRADALEPFLAAGATAAASPAELAAASDLVGVCVWNDDDVMSVMTDENGLLAGATAGTVVAVHSTTRPATCTDLAEHAARRNVVLIDAPVSGGPDRSEAGTLLVMVGGPSDTFELCLPAFERFASRVIHLGPVGTAQTAKLVNNSLLSANVGLASMAVELGAELGIDADALVEVFTHGSATSFGMAMLTSSRGSPEAAANALGYLDKDVDLLARIAGDERRTPGGVIAAAESGVAVLSALAVGPPSRKLG